MNLNNFLFIIVVLFNYFIFSVVAENDYFEPSDTVEPSDASEPSNATEPSDIFELYDDEDYNELFDDEDYNELYDDENYNELYDYEDIETDYYASHDEERYDYSEPTISFESFDELPTDYEVYSNPNDLNTFDLYGVKKQNCHCHGMKKHHCHCHGKGKADVPKADIPKTVETLWVKHVSLTQEIVDTISELINLKSIIFDYSVINKKLDFKKFENLKNLEHIYIDGCKFYLSDMLQYCKSLKKFEIMDATIYQKNLDAIGYLTELEELNLIRVSLIADFTALKKLKNLTTFNISCSGYDITFLSKYFYSLTNLKSFSASSCDIAIPASKDDSYTWSNLKNLEYFNVEYNRNGRIDLKNFGNNPNLKQFIITIATLPSIPESIGNLKNIEILNLSNNKITSVPESIGNLETLRILNLNDNDLTSLPDKIGNLKNLEEFYFTYNDITRLPESFKNLTQLRVLDGHGNDIDIIPTEIKELPKVEYLNLN